MIIKSIEERITEQIGAAKTEKIMKLSEIRDNLVETYFNEEEKFREWNKNIEAMDYYLRNDWSFAEGNYDTSYKTFKKELDESFRETIVVKAGGRFMEIYDNVAAGKEKKKLEARWENMSMDKENVTRMICDILSTRKNMLMECAHGIVFRIKGREWMNERGTYEQARDFGIGMKNKMECGEGSIGKIAALIFAIIEQENPEWGIQIAEIPNNFENGKWIEIKGMFKIKAYSKTSDIVFLDEKYRAATEKFIKEGMMKKHHEENEAKKITA